MTDNGETPSFNNEDMVKVYETLKALHDDGYTTKKGDDPLQLFHSGDLLVWPEGIWMKAGVVDAGIDYGMLPTIAFDAANTKSWTSSHNFVQFADDNRTEEEDIAVAKFIKYMGEEQSFIWARDGGQVPAHVSINEVPEFHDLAQSFLADPERGDELAIYYYLHWGLFDTAFSRNGWEPVFGTMGIEATILAAPPMKTRQERMLVRRRLLPYAYIAPHLFFFAIFFITPAVYGIYAAFTKWNLFNDPVWTGLENFRVILLEEGNTYYKQLRKGVRKGWLSAKYAEMGERAAKAVLKSIEPDGTVTGVSGGTAIGATLKHYRDIIITPTAYGQGLAFLMLCEMM